MVTITEDMYVFVVANSSGEGVKQNGSHSKNSFY